jgi:hypothetical protein
MDLVTTILLAARFQRAGSLWFHSISGAEILPKETRIESKQGPKQWRELRKSDPQTES